MHKDQNILRALSTEAVAYRRKAHRLSATSCELRNHPIVDAQLCNDVIDKILLVGAKCHDS
jgi:hypothetical protein